MLDNVPELTTLEVAIGFSRPKNHGFPVFSWLVRLFERSTFSHVYLSWTATGGVPVVYEASGSQVRFINRDLFDDKNETIVEFRLTLNALQKKRLEKFCYTNVGIRYGWTQILGIAWSRVFGLKFNPFSKGKRAQVCSETVAYFLQNVLNYPVTFNKDTAGPRKIYEFLISETNKH